MRATFNMTPVIALSDIPRQGRDADRFARGIHAYADILRSGGAVIVSTHWDRSNASPSVIIEIDDRDQMSPETLALAERAAELLQRAGLSTEFGHSWPRENAIWKAIVNAHGDASFPLIHISVPARFGSDLMIMTARALEPLRRETILLVGLCAAFGEAIRRDGAPSMSGVAPPWITDIIQGASV